jgi:hypothetical protein
VRDPIAKKKERHPNLCRSERGKQPRVVPCSTDEYDLCQAEFAFLSRNFSFLTSEAGSARTAAHAVVRGRFSATFSARKPPMWRNGRRNGLKIEVLAIFLLFKIDQIEPNLPG